MDELKLYVGNKNYSSWSMRPWLAMKAADIPFRDEVIPFDFENNNPAIRAVSETGKVPLLVHGDFSLWESLAIIEYLEETHPEPPLLPKHAVDRAFVRSLALTIACEIHPLNNLRVLRYLVRNLKVSEDDKIAWYRHWCERGLASIETILARDSRVRWRSPARRHHPASGSPW